MSQENVDFIRRASDALRKGDMEAVEALLDDALDPRFEYQSLALDQVRTGLAGMRGFFADMREVWRDYDQEIIDIVDLGDNLVVVLWTFSNDRAVRAKAFYTKAEALEAAGLSG